MKNYIIALVAIALMAGNVSACCEDVDNDRLADAIYMAEGGQNTNHPYGILKRYKVTTPRQACINTIKHAKRDYDGEGCFIDFLGSRYCPIGADNDPGNLNINWVGNVKYFLNR